LGALFSAIGFYLVGEEQELMGLAFFIFGHGVAALNLAVFKPKLRIVALFGWFTLSFVGLWFADIIFIEDRVQFWIWLSANWIAVPIVVSFLLFRAWFALSEPPLETDQ